MSDERKEVMRYDAAVSSAGRRWAACASVLLTVLAGTGTQAEIPGDDKLPDAGVIDGKASLTTGELADEAEIPRFNPRCEDIASKNLVRNSSFECGTDLWSSLGKPAGWGGDLSGLYGALESGGAWHGDSCLRIDLGPGVTPVTCFDVWPPVRVTQHAPLAANVGWMTVTRGQPLTLSAYLRASVPGAKARFLFRFAKNALGPIQEASREFTLSMEWTRYTFTQTALDEDVCVAIGPDMTEMPGAAASFWLDAVQLEAGAGATEFETREPVELGITTGRYGNVYEESGPVTFTVCADNRSDEDVFLALRLELEDYFGTALPPAAFRVDVPRGRHVTVPWDVSVPGKGCYRGNVTWAANGRDHARKITLTVIEPYPYGDSVFGLNHPATTREQLRLLAKAGIRWVRTWAVNWEWVEPAQGQISWTAPDEQLAYLASAGMRALVLFPNPSTNWASSAPATIENRLWYRMAYAPTDPQRLFDFVGKAVNRYRQSCEYWEFLNEPVWVPDFCLPQSGGYKVADYIQLLEGAYRAIKAADPNAAVIGGLAIEPKHIFGDEFISQGGLGYCDILNLHPYGGLTVPEEFIKDFERIQNAMRQSGQRKPIWATETAYYAVDDKPWTPWAPPPGHFSAGLLLPDERTAADYIVRHAIIMLAYGTARIFYHEPIEGMVNNGAMDIENTFLGVDAVPRKCYAALSALANMLGPSPRYAGPLDASSADNVYGYAFQCDDCALLAAWTGKQDGESKTIELVVPEGCTVYNVMGNKAPGEKALLTESPIYLRSSSMTAEALLAACTVQGTAV